MLFLADSSFTLDWSSVLYIVIGLVVGLVVGFLVSRKLFERELKKNPPINEKMIRAMFSDYSGKKKKKNVGWLPIPSPPKQS